MFGHWVIMASPRIHGRPSDCLHFVFGADLWNHRGISFILHTHINCSLSPLTYFNLNNRLSAIITFHTPDMRNHARWLDHYYKKMCSSGKAYALKIIKMYNLRLVACSGGPPYQCPNNNGWHTAYIVCRWCVHQRQMPPSFCRLCIAAVTFLPLIATGGPLEWCCLGWFIVLGWWELWTRHSLCRVHIISS